MPERAVIQVQVRTDAEQLDDLEGDLERVEASSERVSPVHVDVDTSEATQSLNAVREGLKDTSEQADQAGKSMSAVADTEDAADVRRMGSAAEATGDRLEDLMSVTRRVDASASGMIDEGDIQDVRRLSGALKEATDDAQRLDRTDPDVDVDVDRTRRRLPGGLNEVRQGVRFLGSLPLKLQALTGAAAAATAAIGTAGGLAAAATALASKFGSAGLQQDIQSVQSRFKGVAATISDEFAPIIRGQVIPAAEGLANFAANAADELAGFTSAVLRATTGLERAGVSDQQVDRGRFAGPVRTRRAGDQQPEFVARFGRQERVNVGVDRATRSEITAQQRQIQQNIVAPILAQIRAARDRVISDPTFSREQALKQILKLRTKLNEKLQNTQETVRTGLQPAFSTFIQRNLQGLGQFRKSLSKLQDQVKGLFADASVQQVGQALEKGLIQTPNDAEAAISRLNERLGETADEQLRQRILVLRRRVKQLKTEFETLDTSGLEDALAAMRDMGILQERLSLQDVLGGQPTRVQEAVRQLQGRLQRLSQRPFLPQAAKADRQVQAVIRTVQSLQQEGKLLSEQALRGFLEDLFQSDQKAQQVIKRLREMGTAGQEASVSVSGLEDVRRRLRSMEAFGQISTQAERARAKVRLLEQALARLREQGADPQSEEVRGLNRALDQARSQAKDLEDDLSESISTGARIGANAFQGVMSTAVGEITRQIENNFARAITSAVLQSLSSAAVERLTTLLEGSSGDDDGSNVASQSLRLGTTLLQSQLGGGRRQRTGTPGIGGLLSLGSASGSGSGALSALGPALALAVLGQTIGRGFRKDKNKGAGIAGLGGAGAGALLGSVIPGVGTLIGAGVGALLGGLGGGLFAKGGPVRHPGVVRGPGGPRDDRIPAMLSNGEFVVQAPSARSAPNLLRAINEDPQVARQVERMMQERQLAKAALTRQTGQEPRGLAHGGFASGREEKRGSRTTDVEVAEGASSVDATPAGEAATIGRTVDYHPGAAGSASTPRPAPEVTVQPPATSTEALENKVDQLNEGLQEKLDEVAARVESMEVRIDSFGVRDELDALEKEAESTGVNRYPTG